MKNNMMYIEPDYFPCIEKTPIEVQEIVNSFSDEENDYPTCEELVKRLETVGWTCDYGLDASPFGLMPILSAKNATIAKMMGWKQGHPELLELRWHCDWFNSAGARVTIGTKEPLSFHCDWNWIMMACKELMSKYSLNVRFDMMDVFVMDAEGGTLLDVDFPPENEWIDAVFEAVYLASKYVLENDFSDENE